jgi:hypothetical protein
MPNPNSTYPSLSIIVPTTGDSVALSRCLEAVEAARDEADEVILVNDEVMTGPANARNCGATAASNPILVFVDSDVEIAPHALDMIRTRFATDPGLVAVFGSYDDAPEEEDVVSTFRNLLHHYVHHQAAGSVASFWSGLGAVRRSAFEAVGGFDVRIVRASVEDIEFGARLSSTGRIQLDPEIQGKHLKRWSLVNMVRTDLTCRGIPWARLAVRGRATRSELNLSWRHRVSAASSVMAVVAASRRRPGATTASIGVLWAANRPFYELLARRGTRYVIGGAGLHIVHHLTSVVSLGVGLLDPGALISMGRAVRPGGGEGAVSENVLEDRTARATSDAAPDQSLVAHTIDATAA